MTSTQLPNTTFFLVFIFLSTFAVAQAQNSVSTFVPDPVSRKLYHAYDESYALIVGIDTYAQVEARTSSVSSATTFKELLMSRFGFKEENIVFLLNSQARKNDIMDGLKKLQRRSSTDRLLIFFSGRGYTATDGSRKEYGFFIPFDGRVQSPGQAVASCISLDEVKESINANSAKQTLVLLDFTVGGLPVDEQFNGLPPPRLGFQHIVTLPSKELYVAGSRTETLMDDPGSRLSYFTSKLIEALSSETADVNGDGIITGTELAARTSVSVMKMTQQKLHPQFGFIDKSEGDFLFILPHNADTSRVSFAMGPSDAALLIDDKQVNSRGNGIPVASPRIGAHTFQVQHEGYKTFKNEFFVNGRISIQGSVDLEKIPAMGLLVKVSEPDAKVSVDGKFIGMPEEALVVHQIEKGTHIVRADLDGYFSDSASVTVEKSIQYIVNLKLTSRNGFLSVRSSEGVIIALNGKEIGMQRVIKKEVLPGSYTVRLSGIGYSPYERTIVVHDSESIDFNYPMYRPTLGGALLRSAVFPGWGQSYSGRTGIVYSGIFILLGASSVGLQLDYMKASSDYTTDLHNYNQAKNSADSLRYSQKLSGGRTTKNDFNYSRLAAFGITGAFYLYNLINVWGNDPADLIREEEGRTKGEKLGLNVSLGFDQGGPALLMSFHF